MASRSRSGEPPPAGMAAAPPRRWLRRAPAAAPRSLVCCRCGQAGQIQLAADEPCATCRSQAAWDDLSRGTLRIDHADVAAAELRRQGELAGVPWWRRAAQHWMVAVSVAVAVVAALAIRALLAPRPIGPLTDLLEELRTTSRDTTLLGGLALAVGVVALLGLRRRRSHRHLPTIAAHASAIIAGAIGLVLGGLHWWGYGSGHGWQYTSMPPRSRDFVTASMDRVLAATVVILAPDKDGDARGLSIGTGAIIATEPERAWVVTCSHVAVRYASVGAIRHAHRVPPVWIQLSDGRSARGRVRWAAPPPLDVVLIEVPMVGAPAAVEISRDADAMTPGTAVTFVPNPYRDGWMIRTGTLLRRERHATSAGVYDLLYTDLLVIPGDSGSGLYDSRGRLVGLNTWTRRTVDGASEGISLPSETMRTLVDAIATGRLDELDDTTPQPAEHL